MAQQQNSNDIIEKLQTKASDYSCGGYLASLDELHRAEIYNVLGFERLERKNHDIIAFFTDSNSDWPQTFYLMLLRTMGGKQNNEAFTCLAHAVPYAAVLREKLIPQNIETMLIGASGLLELYPHDEYILNMKRNFEYLAAKYSISTMPASSWLLTRNRPNNHPILRMSQVASFLAGMTDIMDRMLECRTSDDVHKLFSSESSAYWMSHYAPAKPSEAVAKRMGHAKTDLLAINLVAQMQFAYGSYTHSETLLTRAISLLEHTAAENNSILNHWYAYGPLAKTAFDSQALLQLALEYCNEHRCAECPVGRRIIARMADKEAGNTID